MSRTTKDPGTRRAELMDAAEELFNAKGFNRTSVDDIVKRVGVAKGLFYYYFRSKDDLVKAMVERMWGVAERDLRAIVDAPDLSALEKFERYAMTNQQRKRSKVHYIEVLEGERNVPLVHWMEEEGLRRSVPLITRIVEQGVREGVFDTEYPEEATEFVMRGAMMLMTKGLDDERVATRRLLAYMEFWERILGAEPGTLVKRAFPGGEAMFKKLLERPKVERGGHNVPEGPGGG